MAVAPYTETAIAIIEGGAFFASGASSPASNILSVYGQNASKMIHVFDGEPLLEPLVKLYGSRENAFAAIHIAAQQLGGKNFSGYEWINVGNTPISVGGRTIDGIFRIGSFGADLNHPKYPLPKNYKIPE
jgi:hypothetical protein